MKNLKILFIQNGKKRMRMPAEGSFIDELKKLGELTIIKDDSKLTKEQRLNLIRNSKILLTMWNSAPVPVEIADNPGELEYICNITGGMPWIPIEIIESEIVVTNWGNVPANRVAEGAISLLLAVMKDLPAKINNVRNGNWQLNEKNLIGGTLESLRLGIFGFGAIGHRFTEMVKVFKPEIYVYDPYVDDLPAYCKRVNSLEELFKNSEAVAIHAGLTDKTRGIITKDLLKMLPENGILINTARGKIVDEDALLKELETGRIRAGIDVYNSDIPLPDNHPARKWENVIFSCHSISKGSWPERSDRLLKREKICLKNIKNFIEGKSLSFIMTKDRYLRST